MLNHDASLRQEKEYIICCAIWYKELVGRTLYPKNITHGIVLCGFRHGFIIDTMMTLTGKRTIQFGENSVGETESGFLTNLNRFVGRVEAGEIAFKAGQITELSPYLYSEDLW